MRQVRVGKTPLYNSPQLSGKCRGATIWVKDESKNPFGTFKDRRCAALIGRHRGEPVSIYVHITSGNSGYSLGMLAKEEQRQSLFEKEKKENPDRKIYVVNIVDKKLPESIKERLRACSIVHEMELTDKEIPRDEMIRIARNAVPWTDSEIPESQIHTVEEFTQANGYRSIIDEIKESGVKPKCIVCPMGEGELAVALTAQAKEVWPENTPTIVGITIPQNILVRAKDFVKKIRGSIADKLVNPCSKFKELVDVYRSQGRLNTYTVSDRQIARAYRYLKTIGVECEPSAAAAFAGAHEVGFLDEGNEAVIINTGKGLYDQKAVDKLWISKLWRGVKRAGLALTGAALLAGVFSIWYHVEKKQHDLWRRKLEVQAVLYYDKPNARGKRDHWLSGDEILNMCTRLNLDYPYLMKKPKRKCEAGPHPTMHSVLDFTDLELAFLVTYATHADSPYPDMISRDIAGRIREAWRKGWFRIEGTKIKYDEPKEKINYGAIPRPIIWGEIQKIKNKNRDIEKRNKLRELKYIK